MDLNEVDDRMDSEENLTHLFHTPFTIVTQLPLPSHCNISQTYCNSITSIDRMQISLFPSSSSPLETGDNSGQNRRSLKRKCDWDSIIPNNDVYEVLQRIKKIKFTMYIKIHTLNGRIFDLDIDAQRTIRAIKEKIFQIEGIPVDLQKLIFNGKQILDFQTVYACGIIDGSIVYLVLAVPHRSGVTGISIEHRREN